MTAPAYVRSDGPALFAMSALLISMEATALRVQPVRADPAAKD